MSETKKKVPQLRFPGFSGEWEERKLGDITEFLDEQRKPLESSVREPGPYPYYGASGIIDYVKDYLFDEELILLSEDGANIIDRNYRVCFLARGKYWVNNHAHVLKSRVNHCNGFICESLERISYDKYNTGTAQPKLNKEVCRNIKIMTPDSKEQEIIASFFQKLDYLITLHQRKLTHLQARKKGLLQKMFPEDGELFPELRFPGFTDSWEERSLRDVVENFEYGLNAAATEFDGVNKYLRITDIDDSSRKFKIDSLSSPDIDLSSAENYKLQKGDVLFTRTGASVGKTYRYTESDGLVYYAGFLIRARIKSGFDTEFIFQNTLTSKYDNFIRVTSQRSGQPGVNAQEYSGFKLLLPELAEQKNIGELLSRFDRLITLHQRKLDHLQTRKKALLQQLFV